MSFTLKQDLGGRRESGFVALPELRKPWVERFMVYQRRTIPVVATRLSLADKLGGVKARWGINRMRYSVLPGLYAVGSPVAESLVFVTANYKMSFDALRSSIDGLDAWILVLDTKGINVWCAAGKGTFGTEELAARLASTKLSTVVTHRRLVLPQLGASGVSAPEIARRTGFSIDWAPVRAADIKAWLAAGKVKTEDMRLVRFDLRDRMAVAPIELVHAWPIALAALALGALYGLPSGESWAGRALAAALFIAGTIPVGTLVFPAIMPWLPGKAFVLKGAILGALYGIGAALLLQLPLLAALGGIFLATPVVGFLAMNFTGSSTFTCQPGALAEVEKSFWPEIASLVSGLGLAAVSRIFGI
jgi:CO dehydrogenase/acetyl-CoA synthase gamma subunit (corrinoid Fe-S protein)